ncbi:MAG: low molecular weight protein arginine phosphatase [Candidatus Omnitrophota bacterium]
MKNIKKILFVCTGNSCRSIMAEAYLKERIKEENLLIEVRSAGTSGMDGSLPTRETLSVLKEDGIVVEGYESKMLTEDFVKWADLILVMEPRHQERIQDILPGCGEKVHGLAEFDKEARERIVYDPIGGTLDFYRKTFERIKSAIEELILWLKQ